jgi:mannose-6-phosphate isomerase-like protein (cupin superfamily)
MHVIEQQQPQATPIPGVAHTTLAGEAEGLKQLSVWRQVMAPGGATPPHTHDCDEIVLCQAGRGEIHIAGRAYPFGADCTIVLPRGTPHQIFNTGTVPMETLGIFGATPVGTFGPDGDALALPWRT